MDGAIFKSKVIKKKSQVFMTVQEQFKDADRKRNKNILICGVLICLFIIGLKGLEADPVEFQGVLDSGKKIVLVGVSPAAIATSEPIYIESHPDYFYAMAEKDIVSVPSGIACTVFDEPFKAWPSFKEKINGTYFLMVYKVKVLGKIRYVPVADVKRVNKEN